MLRNSHPHIVSLDSSDQALRLERLSLRSNGSYDEAWIQTFIDQHPEALPIGEIEPAFWPAKSCCMELPLRSGYVDNLFVTPLGDLIMVECKLWRNVEARREVIAQVIDYAKDLQQLSYESLEEAIRKARKEPRFKLFDLVAQGKDEPEMEESEFIDAVSRNLRRGRCLLMIVGDGISENVESITEFMQQHAGLHFALSLVQLAVYKLPQDGDNRVLVVPSVPIRTVNIIRGIVQIADERVIVTPPKEAAATTNSTTLTEDEFLGKLDQIRPGTSSRLLDFVKQNEDLQLCYLVKKNLTIKMNCGEHEVRPFVIAPNGLIDTSYLGWFAEQNLIKGFVEQLAKAIPGSEVRQTEKTYFVRKPERWFSVWELLDHAAEVRNALEVLHTDLLNDFEHN